MSSASELIARRELLWNLTLRELRGRYKRSILGWGWSLLNPIAFMLIYTFAFSIVLQANPPPGDPSELSSYAFYLLCALLPWSFFSTAVSASMGAIVGNAALVGKVAFPREHLIVSAIAAGLFTLVVELAVLSIALIAFGNMVLPWLPMVLLVSVPLAIMATGFGLALAAANVYFRDFSYLWSIVLQAWFFLTPIVYTAELVDQRLAGRQTVLRFYHNQPMAVVARVFRNLLYDMRMPRMIDLVMLTGWAIVSVLVGWWIFNRFEGRFAEEL